MRHCSLAGGLATCLVLAATAAFAQETPPEWHERAAGIIAVPVALIGIPLTIVTIRKTSPVARKSRLEIEETERQLATGQELTAAEEARVLGPLLRENIPGSVIFRFVVLFVIPQMWGVVASIRSISPGGVRLGLRESEAALAFFKRPSFDLIFFLAASLPQVVRRIIIFALGWPLLKDVNRSLRLTKASDA